MSTNCTVRLKSIVPMFVLRYTSCMILFIMRVPALHRWNLHFFPCLSLLNPISVIFGLPSAFSGILYQPSWPMWNKSRQVWENLSLKCSVIRRSFSWRDMPCNTHITEPFVEGKVRICLRLVTFELPSLWNCERVGSGECNWARLSNLTVVTVTT